MIGKQNHINIKHLLCEKSDHEIMTTLVNHTTNNKLTRKRKIYYSNNNEVANYLVLEKMATGGNQMLQESTQHSPVILLL